MTAKLKFKDYLGATQPKWCPGCGNHGILKSLAMSWERMGISRENLVLVSGIGCSSRLPYYAAAYGFHTLHGRAPTVATGVKLAKPDSSVWIISGDGDAMAIGGNHFLHLLRQNPNVNLVILNNEIYGLTKGQASPTSQAGQITKTTPYGFHNNSANIASLAIGAGASFYSRTIDTHIEHMQNLFQEAYHHHGVSIVEIMVNCIIFNDEAFSDIENRKEYHDHVVEVKGQEPLLYGKERDRMLHLDANMNYRTIMRDEVNQEQWQDAIKQNYQDSNRMMAFALAQLGHTETPFPIGVLYRDEKKQLQTSWSDDYSTESLKIALRGNDYWIKKEA